MANTYKNVKIDLNTTNNTVLYTCPAKTTAIVKSILVSEDSNNASTITISLTAGASVFSMFFEKTISAKQSIELLSSPVVINTAEILKAQAGNADRLHIIASILEIT